MFLSMKDVCKRYSVTRDTIYKWLNAGNFPSPVQINGVKRWREADLLAWEPVK